MMNGYIDPHKLLPDRIGDYLVLVYGDYGGNVIPVQDVSRFNKRWRSSYWSIEKFCYEKVIGWKPMPCDHFQQEFD